MGEEAGRQLGRALARFEALHAEDPTGHARAYHEALARWVERLVPDRSEAMQLAARCQHLERGALPRSEFPEGLAGYKRWRSEAARRHAANATSILRDVGFDEEVSDRVADLLTKKGLRHDGEVQAFEDAICLTFLEVDFVPFAARHPEPKVIDILRKTWSKMTARGQGAALELARQLPEPAAGVLRRALGEP